MIDLATKLAFQQAPQRAVEDFYEALEKEGGAGGLLNLWPSEYVPGVPNHPGILHSMLTAGLAGAGLGYGAGALGEQVLPEQWRRGRLRKTLAAAGLVAGVTPAMLIGLGNLANNKPFTELSILQHEKMSALLPGTGWMATPPIPVQEFNDTIWRDPRVAGPLPLPTQAAASGLVTGAANLPGRRGARFVSPLDVARMAAGMGSGYLSGALVGKVLGLLTGMPPKTQDRLKTTGLWAGVVANVVPMAFGGR